MNFTKQSRGWLLFAGFFLVVLSCGKQGSPLGQWQGSNTRLLLEDTSFTMYFDAESRQVTRIRGAVEYLKPGLMKLNYDEAFMDGQWISFKQATGSTVSEQVSYAMRDNTLRIRNSAGSIYEYQRY